MPIYEYLCQCGHIFEDFRSMNDPKPNCPNCGHDDPEKLINFQGRVEGNFGTKNS